MLIKTNEVEDDSNIERLSPEFSEHLKERARQFSQKPLKHKILNNNRMLKEILSKQYHLNKESDDYGSKVGERKYKYYQDVQQSIDLNIW